MASGRVTVTISTYDDHNSLSVSGAWTGWLLLCGRWDIIALISTAISVIVRFIPVAYHCEYNGCSQ